MTPPYRRGGGSAEPKRPPGVHPALLEARRADWKKAKAQPFVRRSVFVQLGMFAVVLAVWHVPVFNPIKLLVVLFHEMSHVVAAWLTGGVVFGIAVDPGGAGITLGMGGSPLVIMAAGYAGSLAVGCLLYYLSARWDATQVWMVLIAISCLSLLMGWLNDFTATFGVGTLVLMVLGTVMLREKGKTLVLRLIATTSCLYSLIDVAGELQMTPDGFQLRGQTIGSDVGQLATLTGLPAGLIAGAWILVGVVAIPLLVRYSARAEANNEVKMRFRRPRLRQLRHGLYDPDNIDTIPEHTIR